MKNDKTNSSLKFFRSPVGKGLNLGQRVEKQGKGKGAYFRKTKWGYKLTED